MPEIGDLEFRGGIGAGNTNLVFISSEIVTETVGIVGTVWN